MVKPIFLSVFVLGQAVGLVAAGLGTLWWSQDLMRWLIWLVGEEYAIGAGNVIRREDGGVLLTNPSGMIRWMLPFWFLGFLQITAGFTMVWMGVVRLALRRGGPRAMADDAGREI